MTYKKPKFEVGTVVYMVGSDIHSKSQQDPSAIIGSRVKQVACVKGANFYTLSEGGYYSLLNGGWVTEARLFKSFEEALEFVMTEGRL